MIGSVLFLMVATLLPATLLSVAMADEPRTTFSALSFLRGSWQTNANFALAGEKYRDLKVSDLKFDTFMDGKFLRINYTVSGEKKKSNEVIVGPKEDGVLKAWTFTSEGRIYESDVKVKKIENGCILETVTGKHVASVKFLREDDGKASFEYTIQGPTKTGPIKGNLRKVAPIGGR
jgi:hypothetical protein